MKNENIIRAIGLLDEDLIARAEMRAEKKNPFLIDIIDYEVPVRRRFFLKPVSLAACIAAILVIGVAIAGAQGLFGGVYNHFNNQGDIDTHRDEIFSVIDSVSNDDLEITINGIAMDKRQCFIVLSAKALSDEGSRIINHDLDGLIITAFFKDGTDERLFDWSYSHHKGSHSLGEASYLLEVRPIEIQMDTIAALLLDFQGLSLELDMQHYVMDMVKLYSDNPDALEVVEMSPVSIYVEIPVKGGRTAAEEQYGDVSLCPILLDGSLAEEYRLHGTTGYSEARKVNCEYRSFAVVDDATLKIEIVDVSIYSGFQVNGINYYKVED